MSKIIDLQNRIQLVTEAAVRACLKRKKLDPPPKKIKVEDRAKWGPPKPELPINSSTNYETKVIELSIENKMLREKLEISERNRKLLNDHLLEVKGRIRIYCRVKPTMTSCIEIPEERNVLLTRNSGPQLFVFDRVFSGTCTQTQVFEELRPYIQGAIDGEKVCIFTYGQTGSGKTHTIEGSHNDPGLLPRAGEYIFESGFASSISISCFEVYMENLSDLLTNEPLKLQQSNNGLQVTGLTEQKAFNVSDFMQYFYTAAHNRQSRATHHNEQSSRSHTIYQVNISGHKHSGRLLMVDLAGSEKASVDSYQGKTEAEKTEMRNCLEEGKFINKSLTSLGRVIRTLSSGHSQPAYRESKLTRILQEPLSSGKIAVILSISPDNAPETAQTLSFGAHAQKV